MAYYDDDHLSGRGAELLAPYLAAELRRHGIDPAGAPGDPGLVPVPQTPTAAMTD